MRSMYTFTAMMLMASASAFAMEGGAPVSPGSIPHLDHVFVIMMENHLQTEIVGNRNAPFITQEAAEAGQGLRYYGVGHPSLVNYLEVTGGSNFGITDDTPLNWAVSGPCKSNQYTDDCKGAVNPIAAEGDDIATPAGRWRAGFPDNP